MRFNPFKLADNIIEARYRIPVFGDVSVNKEGSFMTAIDSSINLGEYLDFIRKYIVSLQEEIKLYEQYHKIAHDIRNTGPRSEWKEGCRDTFGAGFYIELDEYKEFRELYWKIQEKKIQENKMALEKVKRGGE